MAPPSVLRHPIRCEKADRRGRAVRSSAAILYLGGTSSLSDCSHRQRGDNSIFRVWAGTGDRFAIDSQDWCISYLPWLHRSVVHLDCGLERGVLRNS